MKNPSYGYKCLKCLAVGDVSDIRVTACKVAPPTEPTSAVATSPLATTAGASAAVVGRENALKGLEILAQERTLREEKALLEKLEAELAQELQYQTLLEEEEALEVALLDLEIQRLEKGLGDLSVAPVSETKPVETATSTETSVDLPKSDSIDSHHTTQEDPVASGTVSGDAGEEGGEKKRKRLRKLTTEESVPLPPTKKPAVETKTKNDELPLLDPSTQKLYKGYWRKFVATPQNHAGQPPTAASSTTSN